MEDMDTSSTADQDGKEVLALEKAQSPQLREAERKVQVCVDSCVYKNSLIQLSKRFNIPFRILLNPLNPDLQLQLETPAVPIELQNRIMGYLDLKDLRKFRLVNRSWNELICSNHLGKCESSVISFSKQEEVKQFLETMEHGIQTFPFARFEFNFNKQFESVVAFGETYGRFVRHYVFYDSIYEKKENKAAVLTNMVVSLLSSSPYIESLDMSCIEEDCLLAEFKIGTLFPQLKKISGIILGFREGEGSLVNELVTRAPNMQEIELTLGDGNPAPADLLVSTMISKLEKIMHVPAVNLCWLIHYLDAAEFCNLLKEVQLRVDKLQIRMTVDTDLDFGPISDWIASLGSTLKGLVLDLEFYDSEDIDFEFPLAIPVTSKIQLPFLEKLESLTVDTLDLLLPLHQQQLPKLKALEAWSATTGDAKFLLTEMTHLEELSLVFADLPAFRSFVGSGEQGDEGNWLEAPLDEVARPLPSLANLKNLNSFILHINEQRLGMEDLKLLTYLSSTKKLKRLRILCVSYFDLNEEDEAVKRMISRLKKCHDEVIICFDPVTIVQVEKVN